MKKASIISLIILFSIVLNTYSQTQTELRDKLISELLRVWVNVDSNSGGLTKVIITNDNNELSINAFGKCHPIDCEFGKVKIHEIAASIERDNNVLPFDCLLANWSIDGAVKNAMTVIMKITIETSPNPKLHVEKITIFNDNSGRSDYHEFEILKKQS